MSIIDRLRDPNERFSPQELYAVFEAIAEQYGFYRSPDLPPKGAAIETASMTIPHFEDLGVVIVRPRTVEDVMIRIPSIVDKLLMAQGNVSPSQQVFLSAQYIALASAVIVSPPNFVQSVMTSTDDEYLAREGIEDGKPLLRNIFVEFAAEYTRWINDRNKAAKEKKSGATVTSTPPS